MTLHEKPLLALCIEPSIKGGTIVLEHWTVVSQHYVGCTVHTAHWCESPTALVHWCIWCTVAFGAIVQWCIDVFGAMVNWRIGSFGALLHWFIGAFGALMHLVQC